MARAHLRVYVPADFRRYFLQQLGLWDAMHKSTIPDTSLIEAQPRLTRVARTLTGSTVEILEAVQPGRYCNRLFSRNPRLIVALEELGAPLAIGLSEMPASSTASHRFQRVTFLPAATPAWEFSDHPKRVRRVVVEFDERAFSVCQAAEFDWTEPQLMFESVHLKALADLLAHACVDACRDRPDQQAAHLVHAMLYALTRRATSRSRPSMAKLSPAKLRRSTECLARRSSVRLPELANLSGLSPAYFSRAFKNCTGVGPRRWHTRAKISRAQRLLIDTDLPLAEIALDCGFADQSHFTHVFRKLTGAPPGSWRKQHALEREMAGGAGVLSINDETGLPIDQTPTLLGAVAR